MLSYTRFGEPSQDPIHEFSGRPRMMTDIEAQIRLRQDALRESRGQLNDIERQLRADRELLERVKQATVRHGRRAHELKIASQTADDRVEEIQAAIDEESVEGGRLEVLRSALKETEDGKLVHEGSYQDSVIAYDAKREQLRALRNELEAFDERILELQAKAKKAEAEAQNLSRKRSAALGEKNAAVGRIDDAKLDKATLERKLQEFNVKITDWITQAENVSPRVNVDPGETEASLRKKYTKLTKDYERYEQQIGASRQEIAAEATRSEVAYSNAVRQIEDLESLSWTLKASLIERRERWKKFRSYISCRAKAQFTYLLSERSFRGKLITDHRQKLLELSVEPDITKKDGSGRGAKTLSGGEKSFSQICLLLSIWEAMGSPIRCLDEFDVYMDAVNRKMSIDMLIGAARQSVGRQFILISPGTKDDIKNLPDVHKTQLVLPLEDGNRVVNLV